MRYSLLHLIRKKWYRTSWTYQGRNPSHIIHSDSPKHGLSVCNLFKYSLASLNVEMHTYCYRRTHKACRAGLKGPVCRGSFAPSRYTRLSCTSPFEDRRRLYMQIACARKQTHTHTHTGQTSSHFSCGCFLCLKRIPNRAIRGPVDAFNPEGSRRRLPNCVWSRQLLFSWLCV